jgi:signal transduction histidine kinase
LQLQQNVAADLPTVQVDAEKTIWIISNLLSNAIRHAPNGSMVKLQAAQEDKWVTVSVTDAGTGITPEYKDRIFERYFRIPGSAKGGTGLGLSTSKEMVTAMGGKISVWSELGKGSRFTIHLPIAT